ncbi:SWIM zinc finger family protein [Streptomyces orinoci]|uniref:SWIM zinc finger family protein n=1 Tax=Streptomyces orinoci TaxID=67339 RepID=A0ABV3JU34_STRON|nr:SWIM zinc finger family protein [Streptomyces orinoci]
MTGQGERWTSDQVLALASDEASRAAAGRLATPGPWSGLGAWGDAVWGHCAGSGSTPYRTVVDLNGPGFHCGCPSRKSPCKHALGLLLLWSTDRDSVPDAAAGPPDWAGDWLARRRDEAGGESGDHAGGPAPGAGETARRRAERRMRRIADGARELEERLADLVGGGLAADGAWSAVQWEETAARMIDAQAPGLAARARELGSIAGSGADAAERLLAECALLHTLNQGFLRLDRLPEPLAATVRSRVGIPVDGATLSASGSTVRDHWAILAQRDADDGRLVTRRIWLYGRDSGRMALLLSYGAGGRAPELSLPVGTAFDAELAFHPSASPLRATLGARHGPPAPCAQPPPGGDITAALSAYGEALRGDPWLESWPVVLAAVTPIPDPAQGWQLADAQGDSALPVDPRCAERAGLWRLAAISGGRPVTVFGEYGHRGFTPLATWGPEPVPL